MVAIFLFIYIYLLSTPLHCNGITVTLGWECRYVRKGTPLRYNGKRLSLQRQKAFAANRISTHMKSKAKPYNIVIHDGSHELFVGQIRFMSQSRVHVVGVFRCNGSSLALVEDVNDFFANFSRLGEICISPIKDETFSISL